MTIVTTLTTKSKTMKQDQLIKEQYLSADLEEMNRLQEESKKYAYRKQIVWRNVAIFAVLHLGSLLGLYHALFEAKWATIAWMFVMHVFGGLGITAGAHRLWSHRSYKASLPVRIVLMIMNSAALQNDIIEWSRDHRCHHKWTDTNADPHNTTRGFFFAHMGWLLVKKHPQELSAARSARVLKNYELVRVGIRKLLEQTSKIKENGSKLDLQDLFDDPVLVFQRKYYLPLVLIFCFLLPSAIPVFFWGESAFVAFYTAGLLRYTFTLHATWFINSAAHAWGFQPYDHHISSVESMWTTVTAIGEGGHNFHHTFPQDYRTSEYSLKLNWTRVFIDTCAALGLVYDRKFVAEEVIERQCTKHGDGNKRTNH